MLTHKLEVRITAGCPGPSRASEQHHEYTDTSSPDVCRSGLIAPHLCPTERTSNNQVGHAHLAEVVAADRVGLDRDHIARLCIHGGPDVHLSLHGDIALGRPIIILANTAEVPKCCPSICGAADSHAKIHEADRAVLQQD